MGINDSEIHDTQILTSDDIREEFLYVKFAWQASPPDIVIFILYLSLYSWII